MPQMVVDMQEDIRSPSVDRTDVWVGSTALGNGIALTRCATMTAMTKSTRKAPAKTAAKTPASKPAAKTSVSKPAAKKPSKAAPETDPGKIGKTQLVELISDKGTLTKREAAAAVDAMLEVVVEGLRSGKSVGLPGLGTFTVKATAARQGVRPGTSEKIQIAAGKKVSYKVALDLKKSL